MALRLFGIAPQSIFALRGMDENSATIALGWLLEKSPAFATFLISDIAGRSMSVPANNLGIELQRHDTDGGFTDIEIIAKNVAHFLVEAKQGWAVPTARQIGRYAGRLRLSRGECRIVAISAATRRFALARLPKRAGGVRVVHRSWGEIDRLAAKALRRATRNEERLWLRELRRHLQGYVSMQDPRDNEVFVVSLGSSPIKRGKAFTWIDVVEKQRRYFHPVGDRWPTLPVNYVGFRYRGRLQSVHHVDRWKVAANTAKVDPKWPRSDRDHFVYELGPPMRPTVPLPNGKIYPSQHIKCALDTLLSGAFKTVAEARDETQRRYREIEET